MLRFSHWKTVSQDPIQLPPWADVMEPSLEGSADSETEKNSTSLIITLLGRRGRAVCLSHYLWLSRSWEISKDLVNRLHTQLPDVFWCCPCLPRWGLPPLFSLSELLSFCFGTCWCYHSCTNPGVLQFRHYKFSFITRLSLKSGDSALSILAQSKFSIIPYTISGSFLASHLVNCCESKRM